jgi:DNA polymerase-3 subunit beta
MISAIRRIAILTSSKTSILKMELADGRMAFTTSNPDYGEGRDEIDVTYAGEPITIGFNYVYLLDVLNVLRSDTVTLSCNDAFSPTVITSDDEPGARFVVMPMRI